MCGLLFGLVGENSECYLSDVTVCTSFERQTVSVFKCGGGGPEVRISYADLLSQWMSFAKDRCAAHLGSTYCLVPQALWGDGRWAYGWTATANTPLYYTTNMPQDVVELYQDDKNHQRSYKPKAYCLPLRLTFVLSSTQPNKWEIRQMTPEEVVEAMTEANGSHTSLATASSASATVTRIGGGK